MISYHDLIRYIHTGTNIYIHKHIYFRENTSLDCYLKGFELSTQDEKMPFCDLYCLFSFSVGQNI